MQNTYLFAIFHLKHKKSPFLAVLTWFLIRGKIQNATMDGDVTGPSAAPPHMKYSSICREGKGFPLKEKSFRITATYQKL